MPEHLILLGSSRQHGNTRRAADLLGRHLPNAQIIDLADRRIAPYDYATCTEDDFIPIAARMADQTAATVIFATPVYWYAMSAPLKTFFDRLTDLTSARKDLGRALRGRPTFLLATGTDPQLPPGFEEPFRLTSEYFEMRYGGAMYVRIDTDRVLPPTADHDARALARRMTEAGTDP